MFVCLFVCWVVCLFVCLFVFVCWLCLLVALLRLCLLFAHFLMVLMGSEGHFMNAVCGVVCFSSIFLIRNFLYLFDLQFSSKFWSYTHIHNLFPLYLFIRFGSSFASRSALILDQTSFLVSEVGVVKRLFDSVLALLYVGKSTCSCLRVCIIV